MRGWKSKRMPSLQYRLEFGCSSGTLVRFISTSKLMKNPKSPPRAVTFPDFDVPESRLRESLYVVTNQLVELIETIDDRIGLIDTVLEVAQPVETGAIRVKWRTKKDVTLKLPRLVEWRRNKQTGLWSYVDVKLSRISLRAKYNGNFLEHHHRVVDCLIDLDYLLKLRTRTVEMLRLYRLHGNVLMDKNRDPLLGVMIRAMTHNAVLKPVREARARWMKENPPEKRVKKTIRRQDKRTGSEKLAYVETVTIINEDDSDEDDEQV